MFLVLVLVSVRFSLSMCHDDIKFGYGIWPSFWEKLLIRLTGTRSDSNMSFVF